MAILAMRIMSPFPNRMPSPVPVRLNRPWKRGRFQNPAGASVYECAWDRDPSERHDRNPGSQTGFWPECPKLYISSTKSMTGHMMGAAGVAEAIVSILTLNSGIVAPTIGYQGTGSGV